MCKQVRHITIQSTADDLCSKQPGTTNKKSLNNNHIIQPSDNNREVHHSIMLHKKYENLYVQHYLTPGINVKVSYESDDQQDNSPGNILHVLSVKSRKYE